MSHHRVQLTELNVDSSGLDDAEEHWMEPLDQGTDTTLICSEIIHNPAVSKIGHSRTIIHFDIDCFYAQVEMLRNPELTNKPLGIQQKNIVVTTNYIARQCGVPKSTYVTDAKKKCPDLVLVCGEDLTNYRQMSYRISQFLQKYTPCVERLGFDENFIDASELVSLRMKDGAYKEEFVGHVYHENVQGIHRSHCGCGCELRLQIGSQIAADIREALQKELGITCCAGIGHNKLLAKVVAGTHKPSQQTTVLPHLALDLVSSLSSAVCIPGIGYKTSHRLNALGISSVVDVQAADQKVLVKEFGPQMAQLMVQLSCGVDDSSVVAYSQPQTLSDEDAFRCCNDVADAEQRIKDLTTSLLKRVAEDGRVPQTVRLIVRRVPNKYHRETRQCPVPSNIFTQFVQLGVSEGVVERLMPILMNLFSKLVDPSKPFHLTLIGVCFAKLKLADNLGGIGTFFTKADTLSQCNEPNSVTNKTMDSQAERKCQWKSKSSSVEHEFKTKPEAKVKTMKHFFSMANTESHSASAHKVNTASGKASQQSLSHRPEDVSLAVTDDLVTTGEPLAITDVPLMLTDAQLTTGEPLAVTDVPSMLTDAPLTTEETLAVTDVPLTTGEPLAVTDVPLTTGEPLAVTDVPSMLTDAPLTTGEPLAVTDVPLMTGEPLAVTDVPLMTGEPLAVTDVPLTTGEPLAVTDAPLTTGEPLAVTEVSVRVTDARLTTISPAITDVLLTVTEVPLITTMPSAEFLPVVIGVPLTATDASKRSRIPDCTMRQTTTNNLKSLLPETEESSTNFLKPKPVLKTAVTNISHTGYTEEMSTVLTGSNSDAEVDSTEKDCLQKLLSAGIDVKTISELPLDIQNEVLLQFGIYVEDLPHVRRFTLISNKIRTRSSNTPKLASVKVRPLHGLNCKTSTKRSLEFSVLDAEVADRDSKQRKFLCTVDESANNESLCEGNLPENGEHSRTAKALRCVVHKPLSGVTVGEEVQHDVGFTASSRSCYTAVENALSHTSIIKEDKPRTNNINTFSLSSSISHSPGKDSDCVNISHLPGKGSDCVNISHLPGKGSDCVNISHLPGKGSDCVTISHLPGKESDCVTISQLPDNESACVLRGQHTNKAAPNGNLNTCVTRLSLQSNPRNTPGISAECQELASVTTTCSAHIPSQPCSNVSSLSSLRRAHCSQLPDNIDSEVFSSLPSNIRGEIMAHAVMGTLDSTSGQHVKFAAMDRHRNMKQIKSTKQKNRTSLLTYFKRENADSK